jgi:hypothetical protein
MKKLLDTREDAPVDLVTSIGSLNDLFTKFLSSGSEENGDYASAEQNRLKKFGKINNLVTTIGNMVYFWNEYTGNAETN